MDLSVDVEQNTSITHCLRCVRALLLIKNPNLCFKPEPCFNSCLIFSGASVIQRPCVVNINTTVRNVGVNRRHTKGKDCSAGFRCALFVVYFHG